MADYADEIDAAVERLIPRGNMSEEDWAKVKDAVTGASVVAHAAKADAPKSKDMSEEDWAKVKDAVTGESLIKSKTPASEKKLVGTKMRVAQSIVDDSGNVLATKSPEETDAEFHARADEARGGPPKKVKERRPFLSEDPTNELSVDNGAPSDPMPQLQAMAAQQSSAGPMVAQRATAPDAPPPAAEVGPPSGEAAGGGMGGMGYMSRMAAGATTNALPTLGGVLSDQIHGTGAFSDANAPLPPAAPPDPNDPRAMEQAIANESGKNPLDAMGIQRKTYGGPPPGAEQGPPPPPPPEGGQEGMAMPPPPAFIRAPLPTGDQLSANLRDAWKNQNAVNDEVLAHKQGQVRREQAIYADLQANEDKFAALQLQARQNSADHADRYNSAAMATLDEARRVASTGIDPDRFWNSKSNAQKAMAVLAGALFGFGGKGMDYLQRLDGLVTQDINIQKSDREMKVAGLKDLASGQFHARDFAMQKGAYEGESLQIAKAAKFTGLKMQLDSIAAESQIDTVKMAAANMGVQVGMHIDAMNAKGAEMAQHQAASENSYNMSNYHAQLQFQEKQNAKAKGAKMMDTSEMKRLTALQDAQSQLEKLHADFESMASSKAGNMGKLLPGTDASKYEAELENRIRGIMQGAYSERPNERMMQQSVKNAPRASVTSVDQERAKFKPLDELVAAQYKHFYEMLKAGGRDVSRVTPPGASASGGNHGFTPAGK